MFYIENKIIKGVINDNRGIHRVARLWEGYSSIQLINLLMKPFEALRNAILQK